MNGYKELNLWIAFNIPSKLELLTKVKTHDPPIVISDLRQAQNDDAKKNWYTQPKNMVMLKVKYKIAFFSVSNFID